MESYGIDTSWWIIALPETQLGILQPCIKVVHLPRAAEQQNSASLKGDLICQTKDLPRPPIM